MRMFLFALMTLCVGCQQAQPDYFAVLKTSTDAQTSAINDGNSIAAEQLAALQLIVEAQGDILKLLKAPAPVAEPQPHESMGTIADTGIFPSPSFVQFSGKGCPPCKGADMIVPEWVEKSGWHYVHVDCDDEPRLADTFDIKAYPTFILYVHGKVIGRMEGFATFDHQVDWRSEEAIQAREKLRLWMEQCVNSEPLTAAVMDDSAVVNQDGPHTAAAAAFTKRRKVGLARVATAPFWLPFRWLFG